MCVFLVSWRCSFFLHSTFGFSSCLHLLCLQSSLRFLSSTRTRPTNFPLLLAAARLLRRPPSRPIAQLLLAAAPCCAMLPRRTFGTCPSPAIRQPGRPFTRWPACSPAGSPVRRFARSPARSSTRFPARPLGRPPARQSVRSPLCPTVPVARSRPSHRLAVPAARARAPVPLSRARSPTDRSVVPRC